MKAREIRGHDELIGARGLANWVSTEVRLPGPGEYVLTYSSQCGQGVAYSTVCELTGARLWRGDVSWTPTHWMPLPDPPCYDE